MDLALAQLDRQALEGEILVRGDGAGATHELTVYCREGGIRFSFGFDLTETVREAIIGMPETAWINAIRADGSEREHSQVCEITDAVDLSAWRDRSRLAGRRLGTCRSSMACGSARRDTSRRTAELISARDSGTVAPGSWGCPARPSNRRSSVTHQPG